jgi:hypothetical protein
MVVHEHTANFLVWDRNVPMDLRLGVHSFSSVKARVSRSSAALEGTATTEVLMYLHSTKDYRVVPEIRENKGV